MGRRSDYIPWDDANLELLIQAVDKGHPIKHLVRHVGISNDRCVVRIRELGLQDEYSENRIARRGGTKRTLSPQTDNWLKLRF